MGYLSAHLQLAAGYKEHFCGKHSRVEIDWSQQEIKKLECANGRRLSMATAGDVAWSKQRRCDDEELPRFHYCTVPPALPSTEVARKLASKSASLATPDTTGSTLKRSRIKSHRILANSSLKYTMPTATTSVSARASPNKVQPEAGASAQPSTSSGDPFLDYLEHLRLRHKAIGAALHDYKSVR